MMKSFNALSLIPIWIASVSGGKDSLMMLKIILENLDKFPLHGVVHFELEIDMPFIKDVIDYMETECKKYNIPFYRVKPTVTWEELYNKYHFPSRVARWCNDKYKLSAKKEFVKYCKNLGYNVNFYIGYCLNEEKRYVNRPFNERYPLVEEGIYEDYILEWAKNVPLFKDYYKYNRRCGCYLCPMISNINLAWLLKYYPDKYSYFLNKVDDSEKYFTKKLGKEYYFRSNYKIDYLDYLIRKKYLPLIESGSKSSQISFL
ncbi:MAG: phosphoadenosine phosphosulfate reductase family protein [Clostridia bacterium]|nr:phosphoadenosine phosphosulfate reductase family protein [Clostridia bacterium]